MISVVIPTYNRAKYIERALNSVLNQSYKNMEIIIVDDNSKDDTENIIKKYIQKYEFIKYVKHSENKGGSAARNTGVESSKGEIIAFLDSDDEWTNDKLEKCIDIFEKRENIKLIYSDIYIINESTMETIIDKKEHWDDPYFGMMQKNIIGGTSSIVIRKSIFNSVGGFKPGLPSCQDWDFYLDVAKDNEVFAISEPLTKYYVHPDSISGNIDKVIKGHLHILDKVQKLLLEEKKYVDKKNIIIAEQYNTIAYLYNNFNNFKKAKEYYYKSLKIDFRNKKAMKNCLASILGKKIYYNLKNYLSNKNRVSHGTY